METSTRATVEVPAQAAPIKLGIINSMTGQEAPIGESLTNGYKLAEQDLKAKGIDVVIGYFEPHGRKDTIAKTEGLEIAPRKKIEYRGSPFELADK